MTSTKRLMIATWLLNVYDAIVTVYATQRLGLVEANPLMQLCLATSVLLFIAVKLLVLSIIIRVLKKRYETRPASTKVLTVGMFSAFLFVGLWNTAVVILIHTTH